MLFYLNLITEPESKSKFEQLYSKYKIQMGNCAKSILKDNQLAEDCVHQAFMRIIGSLDKIEDVDSYRTRSYLITITENIAIDMHRKRKRENCFNYDEIDSTIYTQEQTIELSDEIEQAIQKLSLEYMTIIKLKYIQNMTTKEIAKTLKISEKNVQKRLERARTKLKKLLEEIGVTYNER